MAKFTIDRSQQQSADQSSGLSRFTIERQPDQQKQGVLETAGNWLSDTFGANGNLRGSAIGGVMQGMADPVVGAVQLIANIPGGDSFAKLSENNPLFRAAREYGVIESGVNDRIKAKEAEYEAARARAGRDGFDASRFAGNVAAPSNVALASRIPAAAGFLGRATTGAAAGAVGSAATPETDTENYWSKTAGKAAVGGAAGAVLAPVAGAVGDRIGRMFQGSGAPPAGGLPPIAGAPGTHAADASIARAAAEAGQTIDDIPQSVLYQLRAQAQHALSQNQVLDTAAALRKADFEAHRAATAARADHPRSDAVCPGEEPARNCRRWRADRRKTWQGRPRA
jgi:hypothetical protein